MAKPGQSKNTESTEEDLLQRFMNGLLDKKTKQQVEFVKNPTNIDNALDEVVRWFKFTLKPPNRITHDKLRLAIWDTSFWTFGSNLDTRDLETYPRTYSGHF